MPGIHASALVLVRVGRQELVLRVDYDAAPTQFADHALDSQTTPWLDSGDLSTPEPHKVKCPRPVVQLRLDRSHMLVRPQYDRPEDPGHHRATAVSEVAPRGRPVGLRRTTFLVGGDLLLRGQDCPKSLREAHGRDQWRSPRTCAASVTGSPEFRVRA